MEINVSLGKDENTLKIQGVMYRLVVDQYVHFLFLIFWYTVALGQKYQTTFCHPSIIMKEGLLALTLSLYTIIKFSLLKNYN